MDRLAQRIKEMIAEMPDNLTLEEKEAIARHNLQMEKTLGITKGKPMTVEEADKQNANPKHKEQFIPDLKGYTRTNRETDSQEPGFQTCRQTIWNQLPDLCAGLCLKIKRI